MECIESSGIARPRHGGRSGTRAIARSPRLPEAMRRLQAAARVEAKKRRYFYDVVTEQQKAEFINGEIVVHSPVKLRHASLANLFTLLKYVLSRCRGLASFFIRRS